MKTFFNIEEASDFLRIPELLLVEMIEDGTGPMVATAPGERVQYHVEDLRAFEAAPVEI